MIRDDILRSYRVTRSMQRTANELSVSLGVVRKTLITAGLYDSPKVQRIRELTTLGLSPADIAKQLNISDSSVCDYMPCSKGTTLNSNKSVNALRIRKSRAKKEK